MQVLILIWLIQLRGHVPKTDRHGDRVPYKTTGPIDAVRVGEKESVEEEDKAVMRSQTTMKRKTMSGASKNH